MGGARVSKNAGPVHPVGSCPVTQAQRWCLTALKITPGVQKLTHAEGTLAGIRRLRPTQLHFSSPSLCGSTGVWTASLKCRQRRQPRPQGTRRPCQGQSGADPAWPPGHRSAARDRAVWTLHGPQDTGAQPAGAAGMQGWNLPCGWRGVSPGGTGQPQRWRTGSAGKVRRHRAPLAFQPRHVSSARHCTGGRGSQRGRAPRRRVWGRGAFHPRAAPNPVLSRLSRQGVIQKHGSTTWPETHVISLPLWRSECNE